MEYIYYVNSRDYLSCEYCKLVQPGRSNPLQPKKMDGDWNYTVIWSDVRPHRLHQILSQQLKHHFQLSRLKSYDYFADYIYQKFWLIENQWCDCYRTKETIALVTINADPYLDHEFYNLNNYTPDPVEYDTVTPEFLNFNHNNKEIKFRITHISDYLRFQAYAKLKGIKYVVKEF